MTNRGVTNDDKVVKLTIFCFTVSNWYETYSSLHSYNVIYTCILICQCFTGKGVPSQIATGCTTSQDWSPYLPPAAIVAEHYCRERHAMLTAPVAFVEDPFRSPDIQQYIMADFGASYPDLTYVLNETVNRNYVVFKSTLYHLLTIAKFHHTQSGGIAHWRAVTVKSLI